MPWRTAGPDSYAVGMSPGRNCATYPARCTGRQTGVAGQLSGHPSRGEEICAVYPPSLPPSRFLPLVFPPPGRRRQHRPNRLPVCAAAQSFTRKLLPRAGRDAAHRSHGRPPPETCAEQSRAERMRLCRATAFALLRLAAQQRSGDLANSISPVSAKTRRHRDPTYDQSRAAGGADWLGTAVTSPSESRPRRTALRRSLPPHKYQMRFLVQPDLSCGSRVQHREP